METFFTALIAGLGLGLAYMIGVVVLGLLIISFFAWIS